MNTDPDRVEHRLERRGAQRFEMNLPLAVHFDGRTVPGFTQDLTGRGIFFYAETALPEGAVVELTFTMPSEIAPPLPRPIIRRWVSETGSPCNLIRTSIWPRTSLTLNSCEFHPRVQPARLPGPTRAEA